MTKGLLRSHKDFNHEIWKCSLVAMTQKVLRFLDHKLHIFPTLGRIVHMRPRRRICVLQGLCICVHMRDRPKGHSMSDHQAPDLILKNHPNFCTKLQILGNYYKKNFKKFFGVEYFPKKLIFFSDFLSLFRGLDFKKPVQFLNEMKYFG